MNASIAAEIQALILARLPSSARTVEFHEHLVLGKGGLGLDSIAIVELLLACEQRSGSPIPPGILELPLMFGKLVAYVQGGPVP